MKRSVKTHEFNNKIWAFSYTREHMGEFPKKPIQL